MKDKMMELIDLDVELKKIMNEDNTPKLEYNLCVWIPRAEGIKYEGLQLKTKKKYIKILRALLIEAINQSASKI